MRDTFDVVETRVYVWSVLVQELHLDYQQGDEEKSLYLLTGKLLL